jgi:hypothetical protein
MEATMTKIRKLAVAALTAVAPVVLLVVETAGKFHP